MVRTLERHDARLKRESMRDTVQEDYQSKIARPNDSEFMLETFNINSGYLLSILRLLDEFTILKVNGITGHGKHNTDYYYQMYEILEMIVDTIYPKMTKETGEFFDEALQKISESIDDAFEETSRGIFVNRTKARKVRKEIGRIYRELLMHMEKRGLLTYKREDPKHAMSKFHD